MSRKFQEHDIRTLLNAFQYNLTPVRRKIKFPNVEIGREPGQLPLRTGLEINQPEVFVLYLSSEQNQRAASRCEHHMSSSPSEGNGRDVIGSAICVGRFDRKRGTNIGARVKERPAVG